jgi:mannose-6-phosphate isomerase-like protein (cupin superfamily)
MKQLIQAIEALFTATAVSGGDLAKTANFTLDNVSWKEPLSEPEPTDHPIVDSCLEAACADSGPDGSCSNEIAQALLAVSNQLAWRSSSKARDDGPDVALLLRNFAVTTVIGEGGLLPTDKVYAGFSLQARNIYYPPHAHFAEESYWIIGGNGDWRVGTKPWFAVEPGDSIYHESEARHAMQTNEQPLLTIWLWTSHLDSEVLIIRG